VDREATDEVWQTLSHGVAHRLDNIVPFAENALLDAQRLLKETPEIAFQRVEDAIDDLRRCRALIKEFKRFAAPLELRTTATNSVAFRQSIQDWLGNDPRITINGRCVDGTLQIDSDNMRLVFRELMQNSERALVNSGRSGLVVTIDMHMANAEERRAFDASGRAVWLVVRFVDNGPGVPDELKDEIFLPLTTHVPGGTGLGLSLVRKIVAAHRGFIRECGQVGRGAEFVVLLPATLT
jgi:signal transduction histidine kinase